MHDAQRDVIEFHRVCGIPIGKSIAIRRPELRSSLIMEEACETASAATGRAVRWYYKDEPDTVYGKTETGEPDLVEYIDGLCDLLVVTYGSAVEAGVDLEPCFDEVQAANMRKANGPMREDGKKLKPENWVGPDIEAALLHQSRCRAPYRVDQFTSPQCVNTRRCAEVGYCTWETKAALEMP